MKCLCGAYINPHWRQCQLCSRPANHNSYANYSLDQLKILAGDDWEEIKNDREVLAAFAKALDETRQMRDGNVPSYYTKRVICQHCGEVKLWQQAADYVLGCPWCLIPNKPIFK